MVLQMTRPWKHPVTGIFYFRKRVPDALRPRIGKTILKRSLGTKEIAAAKRLHAEVAAEISEEWDRLRREPEALPVVEQIFSDKQLHALAGELYADILREHGDNPGDPAIWIKKLEAIQTSIPYTMREAETPPAPPIMGWGGPRGGVISPVVYPWLERRGLSIRSIRFHVYAGMALSRAYKQLIKHAHGDYSESLHQFPAFEPAAPQTCDWPELYAGYVLEAKPEPATQKRQRGVMKALFAFLGHDDAAKVTEDDMLRWKAHCLTLKAPITVRDADIAHPKALFRWAVQNRKLKHDPTKDIRVRVPKTKRLREREFTNEEAETILSWSLVPVGGRSSVDRAAAIRWIPWICLYTGARVNEITQVRAEDVHQVKVKDSEPIWVIHITPEAGGVKSGFERSVPLHPHLIAQGFLDYVKSRKGRCLFYEPGRGRGGTAGNPIFKKVGEFLGNWVRLTCGITDPNIAPNHAWRHRFRSACMASQIETDIIDRLDGHAPATVGAEYGSLWTAVALERISRLPIFEVKPARAGTQLPGAPQGLGKRPRLKRSTA